MTDWLAKDLQYNWHPYTQMRTLREHPPLLITRAEGRKLYDADGNAIMMPSPVGGATCMAMGIRVYARLPPGRWPNSIMCSSARSRIARLSRWRSGWWRSPRPGSTRVFYSDNGSTAVEVALKMSVQYWKNSGQPEKCRFISLDRGYHGDTVGCMSVSGVELFRDAFAPLLFPVRQAPTPDCYRCAQRAACPHAAFGRTTRSAGSRQPRPPGVPCPAGTIAGRDGGADCRTHPRTPAHGRRRHACISAGLSRGRGAAGPAISRASHSRRSRNRLWAYRHHVRLRAGRHHTGFPLPRQRTDRRHAAAGRHADHRGGLRGIPRQRRRVTHVLSWPHLHRQPDWMRAWRWPASTCSRKRVCWRTSRISRRACKRACGTSPACPGVGEVRGVGMVAALEFVADAETKQPLPSNSPLLPALTRAGLHAGLFLRPIGNVSYLFLPPSTTLTELDEILDRLAGVYGQVGLLA